MKEMLPKSDLVLSISQNTADDAKKWLASVDAALPAKSSVFRLGDEIGEGKSLKPKVTIPNDFLLCVGTIEARKNHTCLYYAYKLAAEKGIDLPSVVIVGRKGWQADDIYEVMTTDPDMKDKFIFLHNASDTELTWLYSSAAFSVYPSFYEGWGLPVAESLLSGVPAVASNSSSIPEIAGDLVKYFSPNSPEELLGQLQKMTNKKTQTASRQAIKNRYKATSWDQSYEEVLSSLTQL